MFSGLRFPGVRLRSGLYRVRVVERMQIRFKVVVVVAAAVVVVQNLGSAASGLVFKIWSKIVATAQGVLGVSG